MGGIGKVGPVGFIGVEADIEADVVVTIHIWTSKFSVLPTVVGADPGDCREVLITILDQFKGVGGIDELEENHMVDHCWTLRLGTAGEDSREKDDEN